MFLASLKKLPKTNQIILAVFCIVLVFYFIKGIEHHRELAKIKARIYEDLRYKEIQMTEAEIKAKIYEDLKQMDVEDRQMTEAEIKAKIYQDLMPK